ncbi:MAG: hypothetical protein Q4E01_05120, partial [Actinomycetaceae bacterium]|nr:hypothetical protein [Actinomycetaceae bacterium]
MEDPEKYEAVSQSTSGGDQPESWASQPEEGAMPERPADRPAERPADQSGGERQYGASSGQYRAPEGGSPQGGFGQGNSAQSKSPNSNSSQTYSAQGGFAQGCSTCS